IALCGDCVKWERQSIRGLRNKVTAQKKGLRQVKPSDNWQFCRADQTAERDCAILWICKQLACTPICAWAGKMKNARRTGVTRPNLVAAAVRLAGGPIAAALICGVARQTIYDWIDERRDERLIDALRLSRACGVPIENLAGDDIEKLSAPVRT